MTARQLWHWTLRCCCFQVSVVSLAAASAAARSFSVTLLPARSMTYGDAVPQNGQTSCGGDGFHSACAPQAGQVCLSSARTSLRGLEGGASSLMSASRSDAFKTSRPAGGGAKKRCRWRGGALH